MGPTSTIRSLSDLRYFCNTRVAPVTRFQVIKEPVGPISYDRVIFTCAILQTNRIMRDPTPRVNTSRCFWEFSCGMQMDYTSVIGGRCSGARDCGGVGSLPLRSLISTSFSTSNGNVHNTRELISHTRRTHLKYG